MTPCLDAPSSSDTISKSFRPDPVSASALLPKNSPSVSQTTMQTDVARKTLRADRTLRPSLRQTAYERIKHRIITCELKPGEVMSEAILSDALGIGRTPVRQAIDRLMVDGLIEVLPRKGIVVRPISLDETLQINEVRLVNELHSVRRAAEQASASDIALLDDNLKRMRSAARQREVESMMMLDREFHALLARGSRNLVLAELLRNLHERSLRLWFISLRADDQHKRVCDQHGAIVEAIRKHDPEQAADTMRIHIQSFIDNIVRQI